MISSAQRGALIGWANPAVVERVAAERAASTVLRVRASRYRDDVPLFAYAPGEDDAHPDLITALTAACDVLRRSDPIWCVLHDVEQVTDVEWDDALALVEDALDAQRETT